ncbi:D-alanyl-D-alanine carboxypeptidase [Streptomyces spiroverticillatus]|uniref:D-alanyl-D-alanine carboxypeptidase n=1 Tax=Streptomyces finlayi TaxID=67296 RepID=A0A918X148_9ACTN|nr:D-alanyl-D-alanine carboxypeptidase [Streptomyces finlayi]GHA19802.1 D-alanyl-D-alanine carboxypeptidase [Streptomyces spiroverticillatus]GHD02666.1 D-alanyl-D-alanine carboxypeptidase [Streptomyces finlayi]
MAGESPGKSEQRKSSGETAGSEASEVREARDASEKRDPRLAVFRDGPSASRAASDASATSGTSDTSDTAEDAAADTPVTHDPAPDAPANEEPADGGTDQPTATFRTRPRGTELPEASEDAAEAESESAPSGEEEPEAAESPESPEPGDSRLRAAVAAWVATSDDDDKDAEADAKSPTGDTAAGDADKDVPDEPLAPEAEASTPEAEASAPEAEVSAPDEKPTAADKGDDAASASASDASASASDASDEAPDAPDTDASDKKAAPTSVPAKKPEPAAEADEDEDEDRDAEGPDAKAASAAVPAKKPEPAAEADEDGDAAPVPAKKPEPAAETDEDEAEADGGKADGEDGDGEKGEDDGKGVDQATAVFKTMRPSGPKVDQPTAMLKLPSDKQLKPSGGAGAAKSSPLPKPESDAERTSKFVPLKPDDVRAPRPPRKPGETGAQPGAAQPRPVPPPAGPGLPETERTRQQPLPPKPPLDLLAELTNKPAPPETPVRTTVRRFKIWTPLIVLLLLIFAVVQFVRPLPDPKLALSANPTYTFGGGTTEMPWSGEGQSAIEVEGVGSMGTEGPQKPAPIASMAKAMTAYVILKDHPITGKETGPKIKVDKAAEEDGKKGDESTAQIKEGQEYTQRQMLMMLMIPSGNNVARLLGRWDAGSEEKFLEKMNAAAKDLGMTNSKYTDSSGFDKGTVSTPLDQIKLGRAVMENDVFREIVDMPQVDIPGLPGRIYNNNKILLEPGVNGIKTGSTTPAGGNLLFTASTIVDGKPRRIIGAVMNQTTGPVLERKLQRAIDKSLELIKKAQEVVTSAQVIKKGDVVGYVDDGLGGRTPVVATKELKAIGWPGLKVDLAVGAQAGKPVPHAGKAGDVVGEVTVGTGPGKVSAPVALQSDLIEPGFGTKLRRLG